MRAVFPILVRGMAALVAALLLAGCFSLEPVPPADGLERLDRGETIVRPTFAGARSRVVESRWSDDRILIRPRLNGKDVGWFIFDTGASGWTITPGAAREAGLDAVGWVYMQGRDQTTVYRCARVEVGSLVLEPLLLSGLEMRFGEMAFGPDVVGICGRELLTAAIVELDGTHSTVRLHDPASFTAPPEVVWQRVTLERELPHVECTYGHDPVRPDDPTDLPGPTGAPDASAPVKGSFVLDTGCDQAVFVFGPAAARAGLSKYESGDSHTQIMYGHRQEVRVAHLPHFAIGAVDFGRVQAIVGPEDDKAAAVLPAADGLVGLPLLRRCDVWLDLARDRVAIVRPAGSRSAPSSAPRRRRAVTSTARPRNRSRGAVRR